MKTHMKPTFSTYRSILASALLMTACGLGSAEADRLKIDDACRLEADTQLEFQAYFIPIGSAACSVF